ncbi:MAG: protease complex subunit PrcB family protein [Acidobacteriota bacterium]
MPLVFAFLMAIQGAGDAPKVLAADAMSNVERPRQAVARTASEWDALWRDHAGARPRPDVDFSTTMVAAVFLGTRMTAGFEVAVTGTRRDGDALVIEWAEHAPPRDAITAQVITSPAVLVALPRFDGEVRFERKK